MTNLNPDAKPMKVPRKKKSGRIGVAVVGSIFVLGVVYVIYLVSGLPGLEQLENPKPELATKVYSVDGEVLDQFFIKNRTRASLETMPDYLIKALIATEDKNFYSHWGVDMPRFVRAMVQNVITLKMSGASTITQQLARNLYALQGQRESMFDKVTRKIREFITAVQIERSYTKNEILEMYLNVVYFGRSSYGIASASRIYFGKNPSELTLSESAILVGMLRGPAIYDPFRSPERCISRRNVVLGQMVKYGYDVSKANAAMREGLQLRGGDDVPLAGIAPHFVEYVRQQLLQKAEKHGFDIYRDGLTIYTSLDSRMQRYANRAVEDHLQDYQVVMDREWDWRENKQVLERAIDLSIRTSEAYRKAPAEQRDSIYSFLQKQPAYIDSVKKNAVRIEVGFVALDHKNGNILAMVGGSSFKEFKYGLNHVTQIRRQAGSAFKPFVYTVAIDNGYPPSFELLNQPVTIMMADGKRWAPNNVEGGFGGRNTIREGLKYSINLIAVRAIMEIAPVKQVIQYAHRMGIKSDLPPYESLALGSGDVQPLEMTAAFGVFANEGVYVEPISILRIEDKDGNVIEENRSPMREVLSRETAYIMTSMMEDAVNGGTGIRVRNYFHLPAAGKTGTTQEFADAWFVGFTPQITAGVWVGFDNKSVHFTNWDGQGGRAAAPIWGRFMQKVYEDQSIGMPLQYFLRPEGVVRDSICVETKQLAGEYCPSTVEEIFNKKYLPPRCELHSEVTIERNLVPSNRY
jgi:penicillin-binding protein 1A